MSDTRDEVGISVSEAEKKPTGLKFKKVIMKRIGGQDDFTCEIQDAHNEINEDEKVQDSEKVKNILKKVNSVLQKSKEKRKGHPSSVFVFCYKKKKLNESEPKEEKGNWRPSTSSGS